MATVVDNTEADYAEIKSDKTPNVIQVLKHKVYPSLYFLKWKNGCSPESFNEHYTGKHKAIEAATKFIDEMKITQAQKNLETKIKYESKKKDK